MSSFTGNNVYVQWIYGSGTALLQTDYRTLSISPDIEMHDQSAGSDTAKTYITGLTDGQISWGGLLQALDSTLKSALLAGNGGTLTIGPEGTVSGKPKITLPAISKGLKYQIQYNNITEVSCDFQQNGAEVDATF